MLPLLIHPKEIIDRKYRSAKQILKSYRGLAQEDGIKDRSEVWMGMCGGH